MPLSDHTKEIILGSLLGDGSLKIHKGYRNARFSFRHSERQRDYFYWKVANLKEICSNNCVFQQPPDGYSKEKKLRYQSLALESLTELYKLTHQHGVLRIRRKWLNQLTPLALAIWWFDDGSLIANSRKGVFCTDGFDQASVNLLAHYLNVVWNIRTRVAPVGRKRDGKQLQYWRLWISSTDELKKLLRIILPHTPESMLNKVILLYKDSKLQQRWISEIISSTHYSKKVVMQAWQDKRAKWKDYRE